MKTILAVLTMMLLAVTTVQVKAQGLVMVAGAEKIGKNTEVAAKKRTFKFYANSQHENLKKYDAQLINEHFLGADIARKSELFKDTYMVKTPISPGSPTMKTSIRKPVVYNSVKKIEKQLKKELGKNMLAKETAAGLFDKVLDVAISIVNDQTEEFEKEIKLSGTPELLLELYTQRVALQYID